MPRVGGDGLEVFRCAAPRDGIDIGDGLCEFPAMAGGIGDRILALSVRVVGGRAKNEGAVSGGILIVLIDVFNANHHGVTWAYNCRQGKFRDDKRSVTYVHLYAVICNTEADGEAERLAQPLGGC